LGTKKQQLTINNKFTAFEKGMKMGMNQQKTRLRKIRENNGKPRKITENCEKTKIKITEFEDDSKSVKHLPLTG
jgi:hypothetical protein